MQALFFLLSLFVFGVIADSSISCTTCANCEPNYVTCNKTCSICNCTNSTIDCSFKMIKKSFSSNATEWGLENSLLIESLDLSHNLIGRVVPFPSLPIKKLNLASNLISEIDDAAFYRLTKLEELDLSHNQLTYDLFGSKFQGKYDEQYYDPLQIRTLNLSSNVLRHLDEDIFEHMPFLERLSLSKNPLGSILDHRTVIAICSAPKLQLLDLSSTELTSLPSFLQNLPHLRELILSDNYLTTIPSESLANSLSLQILHLNLNPITAIKESSPFPAMASLEQLHISYMPELSRIEKNSLKGLTGLTYLSCHSNPMLSTISSDALSSKNIVKLDLHDNQINYLPERFVKDWKNVKEIDIRGNSFMCDCENQWMLDKLIPQLGSNAEGILCSGPMQMRGATMDKLSKSKYQMRCLDYYGNHPERDGSFLVATFAIVVIALISLGVYFMVRNGIFKRKSTVNYTAVYHQPNVYDEGDKY